MSKFIEPISSIKLPRLPDNLKKSSQETARKLQQTLGIFREAGDKSHKEFTQWGVNRQYFMRSMFYMYLFHKYGNSCIIDENPDCDLIPDLCDQAGDMILKIYTFKFRNATPGEKRKRKEYEKYLKKFAQRIHKCLKIKGRDIVVVPVRLHFPGKDGAYENTAMGSTHANLIVVRKKERTIEAVEPHGEYFGGSTYGGRVDPVGAYREFADIFNAALPKKERDSKPFTYLPSYMICPRIRGVQSLEGYADIYRDTSQEGGGYCSMWSMFTTELILSNPTKTTREIMTVLLDMIAQENNDSTRKMGNYLLYVARGYATFIMRKVEQYFKDIYGESFEAIRLGGNASDIAKVRMYFKPFLKIQSLLSLNPKLTPEKILKDIKTGEVKKAEKYGMSSRETYAAQQVLEKMIKKPMRISPGNTRTPGLINRLDLKHREPCPPGKIRNHKTGRCIKARTKTQKNTLKNQTIKADKVKPCPPGKERNPKTGRCRKIVRKTAKVVKVQSKPKSPAAKDCGPGRVWNPKTKRCNKVKPVKVHRTAKPKKPAKKVKTKKQTKNKSSPKMVAIIDIPGSPEKKSKPKRRTRCPNGTRRNKVTGKCEAKTKKIAVNQKKRRKVKLIIVKKLSPKVKTEKSKKERKRCPNGTRRNKKTGNCESK